MNAYQLPFNAGSSTSPFNYFPQNSHSYGVISPSYGSPRSTGISQAHKNMSSQAPFVSPPNYFPHQSHLQPFTSFASPVQSASGANPYTHNQYNAYTGASSPNLVGSGSTSNFDYSHGYNSANLSTSSTYSSYISNGSTSYSPYSQPSTAHVSSPSSTIPCATNSSYQALVNPSESYLCSSAKNEPEDSYTLNLHKAEAQMQPAKKAKKSGRGRGRRNLNPSPSPDTIIDRIFVWYIDETVLVYLTMAEHNRFGSFNESIAAIQPLYNELGMFITKFAEKYLFLDDLNEIDQSHIEDSSADDNGQDISNYDFRSDGFKSSVSSSCSLSSTRNSAELRQKMALRYRKISELYSTYGDKLSEILDKTENEQLQSLLRRFDLNTKNWLHSATKALSFIKTRPNCLNILISTSPLIKTLSKVMLFGLGSYFNVNNIYSCSKTSKEYTLNRVLNRYGSNCTYIVVGKTLEEQQMSQKLELPFWPVTEKEHFESLLNAMHYYF